MVKHPWWREELFRALRKLADVEYQQQVWIKHIFPSNVTHDSLDEVIHILFDDTSLAESPEDTVGWILENEMEVEAVKQVSQALDSMLIVLGTDLSDAQYIASPYWNQIVETAATALSILEKKPV